MPLHVSISRWLPGSSCAADLAAPPNQGSGGLSICPRASRFCDAVSPPIVCLMVIGSFLLLLFQASVTLSLNFNPVSPTIVETMRWRLLRGEVRLITSSPPRPAFLAGHCKDLNDSCHGALGLRKALCVLLHRSRRCGEACDMRVRGFGNQSGTIPWLASADYYVHASDCKRRTDPVPSMSHQKPRIILGQSGANPFQYVRSG